MSTRPPPPGSNPPPYAMVTRYYKSSLRGVVVFISAITAGWTLFSAISAFQEINVDRDHDQPKFATLSIALGALYTAVCAIELYGVLAAIMGTLVLVRLYSWLSILGGLIIIATAFLRTIVHFVYKSGLITECIAIAQGQDVVFRFGIWGPTIRGDKLNQSEAQDFCNNWWSHDNFSEIVGLLLDILLSLFFTSLAFGFYHQLLDPAFQRSRVPQPRIVEPQFPSHYNPPFVPYDNAPVPQYAPPAGPPPGLEAYGKPPGYEGQGYGVGLGSRDVKDGSTDALERDLKGDDPFADFDAASRQGKPGESRDHLV